MKVVALGWVSRRNPVFTFDPQTGHPGLGPMAGLHVLPAPLPDDQYGPMCYPHLAVQFFGEMEGSDVGGSDENRPPALSNLELTVIQAIHAPWYQRSEWPRLGRLAAQLKRELGIKDLEPVLDKLPKRTVVYRGQEHENVRLTIRGLSFLPAEKAIVDAFVKLHRLAAELFISNPRGNPRVTSSHLKELLPSLSEERFRAASELVLEDFCGGSYTHPTPGEWSREATETSLQFEGVTEFEDLLRRRDLKTDEIEVLGDLHVDLLGKAYDHFRSNREWPDYREFLVQHRGVGNINKLFAEMIYKGFFDTRNSGDDKLELKLTFRGVVAGGRGLEDLGSLAKAVGFMARHYGLPEGEDPVPATRIGRELELDAAALDRLAFLLGASNVGVNVVRSGDDWSAQAQRNVETFDGVASADDLFRVWQPDHHGKWRDSYLTVPSESPPRQASPPIELSLVGRHLQSVPVEIIRYIQSGGSADVYEGRIVGESSGLAPRDTKVAVKVTKDWLLTSEKIEETRHRVQREGSLRETRHPNLARSFGNYEEQLLGRSRPIVLLEYIDGITLKEWVALSGAASPTQFARFILPVVDALEVLHSKGIIHRDVKPSNVMVRRDGEGRVILMDLGIAHFKDEADVTGSQVCMGTKRRASPEFLFRLPPEAANDPAVDVYSLGTLAYDLLTGKEFLGHLQNEAQIAVAVKDLVPVINSEAFPREVIQVVERMLAKKAADRPSLKEVKSTIARHCGSPTANQEPTHVRSQATILTTAPDGVATKQGPDVRLKVLAVDSYEMGVGSKQIPKGFLAVKVENHGTSPAFLEPGFHLELEGSTEKVWVVKDPVYGTLFTERTLEPGNGFTLCFDPSELSADRRRRLGRALVVDKIGRWFGSTLEEVRQALRELVG